MGRLLIKGLRFWTKEQQLHLLLDGLDEVRIGNRNAWLLLSTPFNRRTEPK
jgi:hypothetical protein